MMPKGCAKPPQLAPLPGNRRSHSPSQLGMVPSSRGFLVRQRAAFASRGKRDTVRKTVSGSKSVILVLHSASSSSVGFPSKHFLRFFPNFNSFCCLQNRIHGTISGCCSTANCNLKRPSQKLASAARPGVLVTDGLEPAGGGSLKDVTSPQEREIP